MHSLTNHSKWYRLSLSESHHTPRYIQRDCICREWPNVLGTPAIVEHILRLCSLHLCPFLDATLRMASDKTSLDEIPRAASKFNRQNNQRAIYRSTQHPHAVLSRSSTLVVLRPLPLRLPSRPHHPLPRPTLHSDLDLLRCPRHRCSRRSPLRMALRPLQFPTRKPSHPLPHHLSNTPQPIGTTNELLYGLMVNTIPGHKNPVGASVYGTIAGDAWYRAQYLLQDQKLGHYMHIPPRAVFFSQLFGSFIGVPINYGCIRWVLNTKRDYLDGTKVDPNHVWTGQNFLWNLSVGTQYVLIVSPPLLFPIRMDLLTSHRALNACSQCHYTVPSPGASSSAPSSRPSSTPCIDSSPEQNSTSGTRPSSSPRWRTLWAI
jgi:hypothetical protein